MNIGPRQVQILKRGTNVISMTGYSQFCPVSKAAEVLCQRWTPLIVREVLTGSSRFNEIRRGVPTCSPALLTKRLRELEAAGVIKRGADGTTYHPTEAGHELFPLIVGLGTWGQRWARSDDGPEDLDPGLLHWDVCRYLAPGLDEVRVVVQLVFPSVPVKRRFYWVVVDTQEVDLCLADPGHAVDVVIEAELRSLTQVGPAATPSSATRLRPGALRSKVRPSSPGAASPGGLASTR